MMTILWKSLKFYFFLNKKKYNKNHDKGNTPNEKKNNNFKNQDLVFFIHKSEHREYLVDIFFGSYWNWEIYWQSRYAIREK